MSLADSLEQAAADMPAEAGGIRPANGDPSLLLEHLEVASAARVLAWLLARAPDDADDLCQVWVEKPAGVAALAAVSEDALPKAGRKVLRRAIHRARSRGVEIVTGGEQGAPKVARLPKVDDSLAGAYVSGYDPRGARLVYIIESLPSGGARVFEALLDELRGLVDFQVYRAGRRQVRSFIRDITRRPRFGAVEAEGGSVRALIARRVAAQTPDRVLPRAFGEWRGKLMRDVESEQTPGMRVRTALGAEATEAALGELAALVERREIGPWPPDAEPLEKVISGLREQLAGERDSGETPDAETLDQRVRETLGALYAGEAAAANAERFDETAYLVWRGGHEDVARACLATADALRAGDAAEQIVVSALAGVLGQALAEDLKKRPGREGEEDEASDSESDND
ncbi:MAG: hypothetical protein JRG92_05820 [Deltaproteobacteria bacterium]|nr:hypothetical protein [Deltaproteobacteria bacterium]MBW2383132.1 hypothetical protein [Deltaproteobacteria bacterium]